jgi:hypothetical protein
MHAMTAAGLITLGLIAATHGARAASVSPYDHIYVIMEENHEYNQIIGNTNAPNINAYAAAYGLATNYDAVTHPSAPNYVALTGGSYFGIQDDNAWQTHKLDDPSLTSQIDAAGLSWAGYFQSMPKPGFTGNCAPSTSDCYYASKHNGPIYFDSVNSSKTELKKEVPITKLTKDLKKGMPNYAVIVPDICHDMHGGTGTCANSTDAELVSAADTYLAGLVTAITGAKSWSKGNNAIVITWDEGTTNDGGGGHVVTIVISNNGVRAVQDGTAYSHYSLLGTIEAALGLGCLQNTCTAKLMTTLFAHP